MKQPTTNPEGRYLENTQEIWMLTKAPSGDSTLDGDAFCAELKRRYARIRALRDENDLLLRTQVFPLLYSAEPLTDEQTDWLNRFAVSLLSAEERQLPDRLLCLKVCNRLYQDAQLRDDLDAQLLQMRRLIVLNYHVSLMMSRDSDYSAPGPLFMRYNNAALALVRRQLPLLQPERFAQLSLASQNAVLSCTRLEWLFYHGSDDASIKRKADAAIRSLADMEPLLPIQPDLDWENHRQACCYHISLLSEYFDEANVEPDTMATIERVAQQQYDDMEAGKPNRYISKDEAEALVCRVRMKKGEMSPQTYIQRLLRRYEERNPQDYTLDGLNQNVHIAAILHDALALPGADTPENEALRGQLYHNIMHYALHLPLGDLREIFLNYTMGFVYQFKESADYPLTFADLCGTLLANCQPGTFIHCQMVGQLSRAIGMHLLEREPERFVGLCGCKTAQEVMLRRQRIAHFLYECGLYHDLGKLPYLDLFGIDSRSLFDEEFEIIREHPIAGHDLLSRHPSTAMYADVALGHHVWYDGTGGYPAHFDRSRCRHVLPLDIVTVADCMDAATDSAFRSYSRGKSLDAFIGEVQRGAGTRYAPYVARLLDDEDMRKELDDLLTRGREEAHLCAYNLYRTQLSAYGERVRAKSRQPVQPAARPEPSQFETLLSLLETSESPCDALKHLVLQGMPDVALVTPYIERFNEIAIRRGYRYSRAVGEMMNFWRLYKTDIDAALAHNEEGMRLIRGVPDYQHTEGYHSLLNNAVLGYIIRKDYPTAYRYALEGMQLVRKDGTERPFHNSLLSNTAMILSDVGLLDRAREHIEESLAYIDCMPPGSAAAMRYRYAELLMAQGEYDHAQSLYLELLATRDVSGMQATEILPRLVVLAFRRQDGICIDYWFDTLRRELEQAPQQGIDQHLVTHAEALYYAWHGQYEEADRRFIQLLSASDQTMMNESDILRDAAAFYDSFGRTELSHPLYIRLDSFHRRFVRLAGSVMAAENDVMREQVTRMAYQMLLDRMHKTASLTRRLMTADDRELLYHTLLTGLPELAPMDEMALLLRSSQPETLDVLGGGVATVTMAHPLMCAFGASTHPMASNSVGLANGVLAGGTHTRGTLLYVPLRVSGGLPEALLMYTTQNGAYDRALREVIASLCAAVSVALDALDRYHHALNRAYHDPLTGLYNRAGILAAVTTETHPPVTTGVLMMDIDDFKLTNDVYGHTTGDHVLMQLAKLLSGMGRDCVVGRYGGEEFVLFAHAPGDELKRLAERIRAACADTQFHSQQPLPMTVSIGGTHLRPGEKLSDAIHRADTQMYRAKRSGKNLVFMED